MLDALKSRLQVAVSFPSPPTIAFQIIDLASDPEITAGKVAALISKDPGLAIKLLRVANSPMYSKRRKSDNLRQALVTLGLNAAVSLALGFSLVGTYQQAKDSGIDYVKFWRRAILGAAAARLWAVRARVPNTEDVFLAGLLQDIAVLAIDRVQKGFYAELKSNATHLDLIEYEMARIGADHSALGAWLLRHWKLPEHLCSAIDSSHASADHSSAGSNEPATSAVAARCVSLASDCAEILLNPENSNSESRTLENLAKHAADLLGVEIDAALETISTLVAEIPEVERLFDTTLLDAEYASAILDQARELLSVRSVQAMHEIETLKETAAELETQTRRDALTGVLTRGHLDVVLRHEFEGAVAGRWPLSVVFADLDCFKRVNDTYGHAAGDTVLANTAKLLGEVVRESDYVGRYGGEEFLIVLPGISADIASKVCYRLLSRLRSTQHRLPAGNIQVTISLGLATHSSDAPFRSVSALIEAADHCVYAAKRAGRDRLVLFTGESPLAPVGA
jgi:diguanylate cyclase (GGDEF)-like protein